MEELENNYFLMARTGKVKDFSETCIRISARLRLTSVALESKCKFKTAFEHNHEYKENLQSRYISDGLEVTSAAMIIQAPLPGSVYFHSETAHASQSSGKTI